MDIKLFCNKIIFGCTFSSASEELYQKSYIYHDKPLLYESARSIILKKEMVPKAVLHSTFNWHFG